jgi:hypothetical protein
MTEKELRQEITRIFWRSGSADAAMTAAAELLSREFGEVRILTLALQWGMGDRRVAEFLESRAFPFRGAYAAPVPGAASLVILVGAWEVPHPPVQSLAEHLAQELSGFEKRDAVDVRRPEAA